MMATYLRYKINQNKGILQLKKIIFRTVYYNKHANNAANPAANIGSFGSDSTKTEETESEWEAATL